jgi:hypothetical protein
MPFQDAGGVSLLQLSDVWSEPLTSKPILVLQSPGLPNGRARSGGEMGLQIAIYFIVVDHGPDSSHPWRFAPYGVCISEDPSDVAAQNGGEQVGGAWQVWDEALEFSIGLNVAVSVMET